MKSPAPDRQHPHGAPHPRAETTPLGHRIITESREGGRTQEATKVGHCRPVQSGCPGPQRRGAQTPQRRHRAHSPKHRGDRSAHGPAPLESPRRLREPAPAAPRPLRGPATRLFPARGPRALRGGRRPPSRTPTAEPAADSRVGGSPARRRPRSASRLLTVGAKALRGRGVAAAELLTLSASRPPALSPGAGPLAPGAEAPREKKKKKNNLNLIPRMPR